MESWTQNLVLANRCTT